MTSHQIIGHGAARDDIGFEWLYEWVDDSKAFSTDGGHVNSTQDDDVDWVVNIYGSNVQRLSETEARSIRESVFRDDQMVLPAATVAAAE